MRGFQYRKNLDGSNQSPTVLEKLGENSAVIQVGDLIRITTSGVVTPVATGEQIGGVVIGVVGSKGQYVDPDSGTRDVYTMDSDNQTVAQQKVQFIPALPNYLFSNDADDSLTLASELAYFDTNDENDVDFGSLSNTTGQVQLIQRDPDGDGDASKGLFRIHESQFAPAVGDGRAA